MAVGLVSIIGYFVIVMVLMKILHFVWKMIRCYILTTVGFVKDLRKYGEWAIVTGATDGIGKEYARQLAKRGFNIVLISRTKSKLECVAEEIVNDFNVKTKIITFDFSTCSGYDELDAELKVLDVGILVNNVGVSYGSLVAFSNCDIKRTVDVLHTNIFSDVHMTKIVLNGMVARGRGAIVHISSGTSYVDAPLVNVYSSTKVFMNKFVRSMQLEYDGVINHQLVIPGYVATKLSKMKSSLTAPTPSMFVRSAINTIGIADVTHGCFWHELLAVILGLPAFIVTPVYMKINERRLKNQ